MAENIFMNSPAQLTLDEYMDYSLEGRGNLGENIPVVVYRLMEYSLKEELKARFGAEEQTRIFRAAGFKAGEYFAKNLLDISLPQNEFIAQLQRRLEELKVGVLRIESVDETDGKIFLTVAEDADCSGLPLLGETVCNYDEGFIAGILSTYLKRPYTAIEVNCWATGDRVCRFCAKPED